MTRRPRPAARARPGPPAAVGPPVEVTVDRLGASGDGLASDGPRRVIIPWTLPGERVRARLAAAGDVWQAREVERLSDSPDRITPVCRHFGTCGGCMLQHLAPAPYAELKRMVIIEALRRHGLGGIEVAAPIMSPAGSRRRATLTGRRLAGGTVLGFQARASHTIIDLAECPVLLPELTQLIPALRVLLDRVWRAGEGGAVTLTATETGVDVVLDLAHPPELPMLELLAAWAEAQDLARLSWTAEQGPITPVAARRIPRIRLGGIPVDVPAGGFLQATQAGEQALVAAILAAAGGAPRILDLFAGLGTFTLPLARTAAVHAVEGDAAALSALGAAARRAGFGRVTTERRDLSARPLAGAELAGYDVAIIDPPRTGARAQAEALAASKVPVVVAVSCNPATFARDAAALVAGGYAMGLVQPVDQFVWSSHIELAAVFRR
jgi:23S rRNA (uracil1939-C5)-methyltransferase